jgi:hypothetical protein
VSKDREQINRINEEIKLLTKLMASPARSHEEAMRLDRKRQKLYAALKILEKNS